ncbi:hypothetical protein NZ698_16095 [Chryseobacterium sp. PBS4-4]|uniref:Signal peptidase n=1 Tax=Chryseobacterium edaphi TaxID=2976532 RepID=A0ABT2W926_9FLAO|nr:hypothetical protein [Chryseobacterium edaphi]MCU7618718.1 hypothetical protein [Chryseobacterium edaphi]
MKKIVIICSLVLSGFAFADQSDNPYIYNDQEMGTMAEGDDPAGPGDPSGAPIDQFVPVLMLAGVIIAFAYGRRKEAA